MRRYLGTLQSIVLRIQLLSMCIAWNSLWARELRWRHTVPKEVNINGYQSKSWNWIRILGLTENFSSKLDVYILFPKAMKNHRWCKIVFFRFSKVSILIKEEHGAYYEERLSGPKLASSFTTLLRGGAGDENVLPALLVLGKYSTPSSQVPRPGTLLESGRFILIFQVAVKIGLS